MYRLRALATAFMVNGDDVVMMERAGHRRLYPGKWAALGGHVEPAELNDPRAACLRELQEEAGLLTSDIKELRLRYVINRLADQEIRVQYVYFGAIERRELPACTEGGLHWVNLREAAHLDTSFTTREILRRYVSHANRSAAGVVEVGVVGVSGCEPKIVWAPLEDWE